MASGSQNLTSYQANKWTNIRTFTIGNTGKDVDGTAAVSWTATEILGNSDDTKFYRGDKTWSNALTGDISIGSRGATSGPSSITYSNRITIVPYFHTGGPWYIKSGDDSSNAHLALYYGSTNLIQIRHNAYTTIGDTVCVTGSSWGAGTTMIGKNGTDKVIIGYLASSTAGAVVGAHASSLQAWAPLNISGSSVQVRGSETLWAKWLDGCLSLFPTSSSYREGIRIHSVGSWSDITLCGNDNTGDSGTSANSWFLGNNNGNFYIARNGSSTGTSLFGCVSNVWRLYTSADIPQDAANFNAINTANIMTIYRNGIMIPNPGTVNDGGFFRVRGTGESDTVVEIGTWDDSGAGETIQFNYYPTNSRITPTYSVSAPKASGTICLTNGTGASGTWGISVTGSSASCTGNAATVSRATFGDSSNGEHNANNITSNGLYYYTSNGPATDVNQFKSTDGAIYCQAYSTSWVAQIAQDYRNGSLAVRAKNNGTWQAWLSIPKMKVESYPALLPANGENNWIKVGTSNTSYGLLPSQSGAAGSGHNYLGTSSWYWKYAYVDEIYGHLNGSCTGSSGSCTGNAATATKATQDGSGNTITNKYFQIYNTSYQGGSGTVTVNDLAAQGPAYGMINAATDNPIGSATWVHVLNMAWGKTNTSWIGQIALHTDGSTMYYRGNGSSAISGKAWNTVCSLNTAQTFTGTKSWGTSGAGGQLNGAATNGGINSIRIGDDVWLGDCNTGGIMGMKSTGANCGFYMYNSSGTQIGQLYFNGTNLVCNKTISANITGSSGSCTGNAATATTASSCSGNAATATTATAAGLLNINNRAPIKGNNQLEFQQFSGTGSTGWNNSNPSNDWYHHIRMNHANANGYFVDLAFCFHSESNYIRRVANGTDNGWKRLWTQGNSVTSAVWNDYAEYRETDLLPPGACVQEQDNGHLIASDKRLIPGASIISDTWGFSQGETEKAKTPIAVSGRVLAYTFLPRHMYHAGQAVCSAPGGTIDIMTREEIQKYPDAIIGIVSEIPEYEEWGGGQDADRPSVKVNGRIWIKIK